MPPRALFRRRELDFFQALLRQTGLSLDHLYSFPDTVALVHRPRTLFYPLFIHCIQFSLRHGIPSSLLLFHLVFILYRPGLRRCRGFCISCLGLVPALHRA